jgi:hypothetical protein
MQCMPGARTLDARVGVFSLPARWLCKPRQCLHAVPARYIWFGRRCNCMHTVCCRFLLPFHWTDDSAHLPCRLLLQLVPPRQCQRRLFSRYLLPGGHGQFNRRRPVHRRVPLRGRRRSRGVRGGRVQRGRSVGVLTVSARLVLQVCGIGQLHAVRRGADVGRTGAVLHEYVCLITVIARWLCYLAFS